MDFPDGSVVKEHACDAGDTEIQVPSLGQEDSLERGMAIYSSVLAWKIPWTEEPGGLDTTEVAEHTQHREFSTFPIEC